MSAPVVYHPNGQPIPTQAIARIRERAGTSGRPRMRGLNGQQPQWFPYDAQDWTSPEQGDWLPVIASPDREINLYRDRVTARARDLYRNDGWAKGAIGRILDSTIGGNLRLVVKPDYRALGLDADWAEEYRSVVEGYYRSWSDDVRRFNDLARRHTMTQMFRIDLGHKLVDGEGVILSHWRMDRVLEEGATFATCFQGVDPDRLSNPFQGPDTKYLRGGVEVDDDDVARAYHFRKAHQNDWYNAVESMEWERVEREDPDGWQRVFHDYDPDRFQQHRGISVFAPVLGRLRMLAKYYNVELSAATVASAFGIYVTSPFDAQMVKEALDDEDRESEAWGWYQDMRSDFHRDRDVAVSGVKMATLAPGEKIETVSAVRPNSGFSSFTHEMLRSMGQVLGLSAEQTHNDYSESSWSSARAGIVEAEKAFKRRVGDFYANTCTPVYATWLEELHDRKMVPLPANAPAFRAMRTAYAKCQWLGAARGWVDPVAERQGAVLGLDAGFATLEQVCAEQGSDWEENLDQRAREFARMKELGLPTPQWFGEQPANSVAAAPQPE
jgi:lambda family phage portal protein